MAKCGTCGKFIAAANGVRCSECPGSYHPICLGVASTKVPPNWLCPVCKSKLPRSDNSATPVQGPPVGGLLSSQQNVMQPVSGRQLVPENLNTVVAPEVISLSSQPCSPGTAETGQLDIAHEIRCFREELCCMRVELREFRNEMATLRTDIGVCRERVDAVESRVSQLENRMGEKEPSSCDHLQDTIAELKIKLNERDQDLLLNDVTISGIPESKDESPIHIFKLVSSKLGVEVDERDVVNVERIGMVRRNFNSSGSVDTAEPRSRPLAVRLSRRATRDQLLRAARVRRGLTTVDLQLHGPSSRFYVNERLTPVNGSLFFKSREAGQRHNFKYVWTKDGRIYVKKADGVLPQRIRSDNDLVRIFGDATV